MGIAVDDGVEGDGAFVEMRYETHHGIHKDGLGREEHVEYLGLVIAAWVHVEHVVELGSGFELADVVGSELAFDAFAENVALFDIGEFDDLVGILLGELYKLRS